MIVSVWFPSPHAVAYRSCPDLARPEEDPALYRARIELWLVDALIARKHRRAGADRLLGAMAAVGMGLTFFATRLDIAPMAFVGITLIGLSLLAWWCGESDARALAREAIERGLPRGVAQQWRAAVEDHGITLESWHDEATTKLKWYRWRSGLPTTMGDCVELAERLRQRPWVDVEQRRFLARMEIWRTTGEVTAA